MFIGFVFFGHDFLKVKLFAITNHLTKPLPSRRIVILVVLITFKTNCFFSIITIYNMLTNYTGIKKV